MEGNSVACKIGLLTLHLYFPALAVTLKEFCATTGRMSIPIWNPKLGIEP